MSGPIRRYRKGTVYVNNMQSTIHNLRTQCGLTYRKLSQETGIPIMTLWELGNEGALNRCTPTINRNYERIHALAVEYLGLEVYLRAYKTPRQAKQAARRLRKRKLIMADMETDEFNLKDRKQLKMVRTAFNESCNRNRDDEGYVYIYSEQSEETIADNLKTAIAAEMARDKTWLSKAPSVVLLFAEATGLISSGEELDEEPDEEEDDDDFSDEDEDEDDSDDEESSDDTDGDEEDGAPSHDAEDDDGELEYNVYVIEMLPSGAPGAMSVLLQELCNGVRALENGEASRIEVIPHGSAVEAPAKESTKSVDVDELKKRMRVGGDMLSRDKRIAFIKENNIPYKGDLKSKVTKELYTIIVDWAEGL